MITSQISFQEKWALDKVFLNELEQFMEDNKITGLESISSKLEAQLEIYLKKFALLYADDTVLMSETSDGLQTLLLK